MNLYSSNENYKLYQGNMLDMLDVIDKESIDSIVTDPPYELNFMGKGWDNSGIAFQKETWKKCLEVLKPGGYLLAFGGSRTFHRIACAIEDAGFEIRDTIMWLYGSGFPKNMNIGLMMDKKEGLQKHRGKAIDTAGKGTRKDIETNFEVKPAYTDYKSDLAKQWQGWGTALKPSFEPIIVARKPFKSSLVDNVIEYGVGGINIDECRVGNEIIKGGTMPKMNSQSDGINLYNFGKKNAERLERKDNFGRFPANTILTYDETDFDEVCGGFPNTKNITKTHIAKNSDNNVNFNASKEVNIIGYNDSGSASRYFYCAKASKKDRDEGLDEFEEKNMRTEQNRRIHSAGCEYYENGKLKQNPHLQSSIKRNIHPTVKPTELMQYLVRLVSPNGATILDPFNGSGSTGKAVMYENKEGNKNYKYIGIELTEEYLPISKARIEYVCNLKKETNPQISIFDLEDNNE